MTPAELLLGLQHRLSVPDMDVHEDYLVFADAEAQVCATKRSVSTAVLAKETKKIPRDWLLDHLCGCALRRLLIRLPTNLLRLRYCLVSIISQVYMLLTRDFFPSGDGGGVCLDQGILAGLCL
jgi:hypothetical protein